MRSLILVLGLCVACGGGEAAQRDDELPPIDPEEDTEVVADPQDEGTEPMEEAGPPPGPVEVTVSVKVGNDETTNATFQMVDGTGNTVQEGAPGSAFTVQSGTYTVIARITSDDVMIDEPSMTLDAVSLNPGEAQTVEVRFPVARVRLQIQRNGRNVRRSRVTLFRQNSEDEVATFAPGNDHISISPGRYEADVKIGSLETRVRGLTFMDGATQNIPVNIQ